MPIPQWRQKAVEKARAWILAHPQASIAETMRATSESQGSVSKLRKELVAAGLLVKYAHTPGLPSPKGVGTTELGIMTTEQLLAIPAKEAEAILDGSAPLTKEERRAKLESFIRFGTPDHAIRAEGELRKIEAAEGSKEEIGPGPPQTLDDGIREVADMIEALAAWGGEVAVKKAFSMGMSRYFKDQKREPVMAGVQDGQDEPTKESERA